MQSLRTIASQLANRTQGLLAWLSTSSVPAQRVITALREAGAVTPQTAQRFHPRSTVEEAAFQQLLSLDVIREPAYGRYYLDERSLEILRRQGRLPGR